MNTRLKAVWKITWGTGQSQTGTRTEVFAIGRELSKFHTKFIIERIS